MSNSKLLILGFDGLDVNIINFFNLKNIRKVLDSNITIPMKEDLFSRGWAKILVGKDGYDTGAFYKYPKLDGSHTTTGSFTAVRFDKFEPLWALSRNLEISLGLFNIPSTFPANKQFKGYCVSGAGAGSKLDGASSIDKNAIYPSEMQNILQDNNYFPDVRLSRFKNSSFADYLDKLIELDCGHANSFIALNKRFDPTVSFIAFMSVNRVQGIFRWHIDNWGSVEQALKKKIEKVFINLDDRVGDIIESLKPDDIMLVSDHGYTGKRYLIDINNFLEENGYAKKSRKTTNGSNVTFLKNLPFKKALKTLIPQKAVAKVKDKLDLENDILFSETLAFGLRYIPGIYINDERFGATVKNRFSLIQQIISDINNSDLNRKHGVTAIDNSRKTGFRYSNIAPDILLDLPEGYFPEMIATSTESVIENTQYRDFSSLEECTTDLFTGTKSPLALLSVPKRLHRKAGDSDLTLAYEYIKEWMQS